MDLPPEESKGDKVVPNLSPESKVHLNGGDQQNKSLKKSLEEVLKDQESTPSKFLKAKSQNVTKLVSTPGTKVFDIKKRPLFIGVTGGTAGGKTSICDM